MENRILYMKNEPEYDFKLVMLGDQAVGKSSLIDQKIYKTFNLHTMSTIGASFGTIYFNTDKTDITNNTQIDNNKKKLLSDLSTSLNIPLTTTHHKPHRLNIWDTAGQERYNALINLYCRNADIILLCIESISLLELFIHNTDVEYIKTNAEKSSMLNIMRDGDSNRENNIHSSLHLTNDSSISCMESENSNSSKDNIITKQLKRYITPNMIYQINNESPKCKIWIVGTKSDQLTYPEKQMLRKYIVSKQIIDTHIIKNITIDSKLWITSASNNENIDELFDDVISYLQHEISMQCNTKEHKRINISRSLFNYFYKGDNHNDVIQPGMLRNNNNGKCC